MQRMSHCIRRPMPSAQCPSAQLDLRNSELRHNISSTVPVLQYSPQLLQYSCTYSGVQVYNVQVVPVLCSTTTRYYSTVLVFGTRCHSFTSAPVIYAVLKSNSSLLNTNRRFIVLFLKQGMHQGAAARWIQKPCVGTILPVHQSQCLLDQTADVQHQLCQNLTKCVQPQDRYTSEQSQH
jgi:hypothetical protein